MNNVTSGTWAVIGFNCLVAVIGVLQGVDWVHVVGSQTAGMVAACLAGLNAVFHYTTGPAAPANNSQAKRPFT